MKPVHSSPITPHVSLDRISLLLALFCLSASSGFLTGRQISHYSSPITLHSDTRPPIPTINIEGIRNGLLHGEVIGSARIVFGKKILTQSGVFVLDAAHILTNEVSVIVPNGMQFVASKRGKKYYPVFSRAGENLAPKNRVYFATEHEAQQSGYYP
ncbi:MAG: hypothetical protein O3A80_05130 [bacterium]|nr:hypothetical protein [bacterium]